MCAVCAVCYAELCRAVPVQCGGVQVVTEDRQASHLQLENSNLVLGCLGANVRWYVLWCAVVSRVVD